MNDAPRNPRPIHHDEGRHVAMPLGGIGTGNVAICGDGGLRQWQLHNIGNHTGVLPDSFFSIRVARPEPPLDVVRVLQAPPPPVDAPRTPLVDDDLVPQWQRRLLAEERGVSGTTFRGVYPFAEVEYHDDELPVDVRLEAFTPFAPLDVAESSLPAALFTFTITGRVAVHGWLGGTLQNAVGSDGVTPPEGNRSPLYGGNVNRVRRTDGWTSVVMDNVLLPEDAPGAGQMVLSADSPAAPVLAQWAGSDDFMAFLRGRAHLPNDGRYALAPHVSDAQRSGPSPAAGPSPVGSTWNGGIAVPFDLQPGETVRVRFLMTWNFPNRYVNFEQFGPKHAAYAGSRFWLGNAYSRRFVDAVAVAETVQRDWHGLRERSRAWTDALVGSSLPLDVVERMAAQPSLLRSPTCFHTADGRFFGFEGVLGASTTMWNGTYGGSCPLNCTHVWNYEQALSRLFPMLERNMRETEFDVMQAPEGYIPHRVIAPSYLPQLWNTHIGGPEEPALDGMLGTVLKTYREVRQGAGQEWLERYWPNVKRLLDHITATWDPEATGILRGIQPSTHDIDLCGVNSYMGTYWLAALRAAEEMALLVGDDEAAKSLRERFEAGSRGYDEALWNGEYYIQVLGDDETRDFQWERGCLADQLVGQWWAHQLELGYVLPQEHVRSALRSVVRYNLREGFRGFEHGYRVYADQDDTGLVMCTWPTGGRPEVPVRYADEVWSGIEYQVGAHCLREGLTDEGMRILRGLWARHDGRRRNPYNEIECGDHYARAMAGWSVLEALTGQAYDARAGRLRLAVPQGEPRWSVPVVLDEGWGVFEVDAGRAALHCRAGEMRVRSLELVGIRWPGARLGDGTSADANSAATGQGIDVTFTEPLAVRPGSSLVLEPSA